MNGDSPDLDETTETLAPPEFPWPPQPDTSTLDALAETWSEVVRRPARFYSRLPLGARLGPAMVFLIVLSYAGAGADLFWGEVLPSRDWLWSDTLGTSRSEAVIAFLFAGPLALAFTVLLAGLVQTGLIVFGARQQSARETLHVLLYASATSLFQLIPWVGTLVGSIWWAVVTVVGVREVHRCSTGRAAAATFVPIFAVAMVFTALVLVAVFLGLVSGLLSR